MKCSKCGQDVNENAKFCPNCGNPVEVESTEEEIVSEVQKENVDIEPAIVSGPEVMPKKSKKGIIIIIISIVVIIAAIVTGYFIYQNLDSFSGSNDSSSSSKSSKKDKDKDKDDDDKEKDEDKDKDKDDDKDDDKTSSSNKTDKNKDKDDDAKSLICSMSEKEEDISMNFNFNIYYKNDKPSKSDISVEIDLSSYNDDQIKLITDEMSGQDICAIMFASISNSSGSYSEGENLEDYISNCKSNLVGKKYILSMDLNISEAYNQIDDKDNLEITNAKKELESSGFTCKIK